MNPVRFAAVLAVVVLGACTEERPPAPPTENPPPAQEPPVSSAAPFRPCGAIGAGALAASALSPDGSVLAVATLSGQLVLYQPANGNRIQTLWDLPGEQVGVAFSEDGRRLAAASRTATRVWSFPDLKLILSLERPLAFRTTALALSADGAFLATGGFDTEGDSLARVRIHRVADGGILGTWERRYEQLVQSLAFSPDGASLAISMHHSIIVVSARDASGSRAFPLLSGGQVAWSRDGALLASGGIVVRLDTGAEVKRLEQSMIHDASTFSPDGQLYAEAVGPDVKVYRVADWTKLHTFTEADTSYVSRLSFSQDSTQLIVDVGVSAFWCNGDGQLCGPWGNEVRIHPVQDPGTVRTVSLGPVMQGPLVFSLDGSLLVGFANGTLAIWRTSNQHLVATSNIPATERVQFSPDQRQLLAGDAIYDLTTGQALQSFRGQALSPDFKMSAGLEQDRILLRDVASNERLKTFALNAHVADFSPDGRSIATYAYDGRIHIRLLDIAEGTVSHTFEMDYDEGGSKVDFSPDGRWLAVSNRYSGLSSVEVRGLGTDTSASLAAHFAAAFSPDSTVLATGSLEAEVQLWKTSGFTVRERLVGHGTSASQEQWPRAVIGASFARTGQLATLGADRTVRLWCSN
ncbi:WD40 repeat domain-containing protein [Corallococcus sicarius]|uniref:WD40 repeat domain-containing protein n=1 Tax=Corallococcus sicarius TaxID=2316726 RepID=A0A3A8NRN5_9BACT|nr:WD40 repeat domain-containing protein [Corallococcus sicarius]RKH46753.1 WD40 repeat domain-containing protein [Corallococcus sicarius]